METEGGESDVARVVGCPNAWRRAHSRSITPPNIKQHTARQWANQSTHRGGNMHRHQHTHTLGCAVLHILEAGLTLALVLCVEL